MSDQLPMDESARHTSISGGGSEITIDGIGTCKDLRLVRKLLEQRTESPITTKVLAGLAVDEKQSPEAMRLLLKHNGSLAIQEDVVKAAVSNIQGPKMLSVLLAHQSDVPITEEALEAATGSTYEPGHDTDESALSILLNRVKCPTITERMMIAAAENYFGGKSSMNVLLQYRNRKDLVSETVLNLAAQNSRSGPDIVKRLLQYYTGIVPASVVMSGVRKKSTGVVSALLAHELGAEVDKDIVSEAISNERSEPELLKMLLKYDPELGLSNGLLSPLNQGLRSKDLLKTEGSDSPEQHRPPCSNCLNLRLSQGNWGRATHEFHAEDLQRAVTTGCQICLVLQRCIAELIGELSPTQSIHLNSEFKQSPLTLRVSSLVRHTNDRGHNIEIYSHKGEQVCASV